MLDVIWQIVDFIFILHINSPIEVTGMLIQSFNKSNVKFYLNIGENAHYFIISYFSI